MGVRYNNNNIGFFQQYYDKHLANTLYTDQFLSKYLSKLNGKSFYRIMCYPIFHKKIVLFDFYCVIIKKTKKKSFLLNQTIFMEGFLSKQKLFVSFPVLSFLNKI